MNIGKITGAIKLMCLFLLSNITGILFLAGLIVINYAVYQWNYEWGLLASGASLILVALIINHESESG